MFTLCILTMVEVIVLAFVSSSWVQLASWVLKETKIVSRFPKTMCILLLSILGASLIGTVVMFGLLYLRITQAGYG